MKKLLSLLLILLLALSWVGFAEGDAPEPEQYECGDYTYALLEDGSAEIMKYNGSALVLEIPAELDGHAVSSIGDEAFIFAGLTSITLPDSLTAIGDLAFSHCSGLTSVTLPSGLTDVGANPFGKCDRLTEIIITPDHPALATIDGALYSKADKRLICYPNGLISDTCTVPEGIKIIGDCAFSGCSVLTSVTLPDSLTSIGDKAFSDCSSLTAVSIPDNLTSISRNAFDGCDRLTLTVPRDSYAKEYCDEHGLRYVYPDGNDWLND